MRAKVSSRPVLRLGSLFSAAGFIAVHFDDRLHPSAAERHHPLPASAKGSLPVRGHIRARAKRHAEEAKVSFIIFLFFIIRGGMFAMRRGRKRGRRILGVDLLLGDVSRRRVGI